MAIDWKLVRYEFESSGITYAGLAKKYRCKKEALKKRAAKEGWARGQAKKESAKGNVDAKAAQPNAVAEDVLDDHRTLWKGVKKQLVRGLNNKDSKSGLDALKVVEKASELIPIVIEGERLAWGFESGGNDDLNDEAGIAAEMDKTTVPEGSGKAVDGE